MCGVFLLSLLFCLIATACVRLYLRHIPQAILISLSRSLIIGGRCMPFWSTCGEKKITGRALRWDPDMFPWSRIIISFHRTRNPLVKESVLFVDSVWQIMHLKTLKPWIHRFSYGFWTCSWTMPSFYLMRLYRYCSVITDVSQVYIQIQTFVYYIQLGCLTLPIN